MVSDKYGILIAVFYGKLFAIIYGKILAVYIAADMTKMPSKCGAIFIVYDPERKILDDKYFSEEFEKKRANCFVRIYR